MKIRDIRATTVTVPLDAPLRHANGCQWGRFVRYAELYRELGDDPCDRDPGRPERFPLLPNETPAYPHKLNTPFQEKD